MARLKIALLFFVLAVFVFISPALVFSGNLQDKIQQKINAPKNIQYNLDALQETRQYEQYEPYYTEGDAVAAGGDLQEQTVSGHRDRKVRAPAEAERRAEISNSEGRPAMLPPVLSSYAIYRTDYNAELEDNVVTVKGKAIFEVFRKGLTQIPLLSSNVGLIDVSVNKAASFVTMQGGRYYLVIDKPGRYNLDMEFLIKASREREGGPGSFSFEVIPAPISQFEFTMNEQEVEIFVDPSIRLEIKREPKQTVAWAVMPNTNTISVRWTKALPKETITPVKLEPKVYVDTSTYASIGEGLIRCQTAMNYSILQSEIPNMRIALPEDVSILEVQGRDLRDWKASVEAGVQYLDVYLNFGVKGNYVLNLTYERKIGEGSAVAEIPWVKAIGAEREKGYFGLAAATNVELAVNKIDRVTLIDVKELPAAIWSSTANPILLAFKYLNHPFSIVIDVTRHEEVPVIVAAIDVANYVTLQTDEGKSLTKAVYQMRNNVKQFIRLVLPKNATLWSVFVSGKPVKPAKDKSGNILIPLEKSQFKGEDLAQFPVEIVYLDKLPKMGWLGSLRLNLPQTDIPVSQLEWTTYLPLDYAYFNFGGDVKPLATQGWGAGLRGFQGVLMESRQVVMKRTKDYERLGEQFAPQAQVFYDEMQSAKMKGVLPIKIDIPEQGRLFRFSKLLIAEKESPWLSVSFIYLFRPLRRAFWFLVFLFGIVMLVKLVAKKKK